MEWSCLRWLVKDQDRYGDSNELIVYFFFFLLFFSILQMDELYATGAALPRARGGDIVVPRKVEPPIP